MSRHNSKRDINRSLHNQLRDDREVLQALMLVAQTKGLPYEDTTEGHIDRMISECRNRIVNTVRKLEEARTGLFKEEGEE